jgi:hypothetical protein
LEFGRVASTDVSVRLDIHTLVIGREGPVSWTRTERRWVTERVMSMWNPERAAWLRARRKRWRTALGITLFVVGLVALAVVLS